MLSRMLGSGLLAIALSALTPAAFVAAQEAEEIAEHEAAEAEGEAAHDEHEHGPFYTHTTFWASVINFVLLLLILRKLGSKPLAEFLRERRRTMERAINEAAEMRAKAEALQKEYNARLAQLDSDLKKLREDIARAAEEDKARIVADAEETAKRLRRETEGVIEQHAKSLAANVRREVVEAAIAAAEQILRGSLTETDQQRLADGFKQGLQRDAGKETRASAERRPEPTEARRTEGTP